MNILFVEDNEGDVELTRRAFHKTNSPSKLTVAHDGAEALDYLHRTSAMDAAALPDLILLDLNMPRMGGRAFLEIVKQDERYRSIPVIVLTSSNAPEDVAAAYDRHANSYILKPFSFEKFIAVAQQIEAYWGNLVRLPGEAAA
jgi:CheY-like chemotaxis protein